MLFNECTLLKNNKEYSNLFILSRCTHSRIKTYIFHCGFPVFIKELGTI